MDFMRSKKGRDYTYHNRNFCWFTVPWSLHCFANVFVVAVMQMHFATKMMIRSVGELSLHVLV